MSAAEGGTRTRRRVAVIGAGWSGLAAAVRASESGHAVTLFEMSRQAGGRARAVAQESATLDNGQHILVGAYRETLALMRTVGADPEALLRRLPLALVDSAGRGLRLPHGAAVPAFVCGVLRADGWRFGERWALLRAALAWRVAGFRIEPDRPVAELAAALPLGVRERLIDPLCVAALNTPASQASARVFLRVLRDALFSGPGGADLLLPRVSLSDLLPAPALAWLEARGAVLRLGTRVNAIEAAGAKGWRIDGELFDAVVLACSAAEAARLAAPLAPNWGGRAAAFDYQPIVTTYLRSPGSRLAAPMVALAADETTRPAQFAFDLGAIDANGARDGLFAFVVSGARSWLERGLPACEAAVLRQAAEQFPAATWQQPPEPLRTMAERRATFACVPGLARPPTAIAPGLAAAGDYVQGPYPATLEGAVRSGLNALSALGLSDRSPLS